MKMKMKMKTQKIFKYKQLLIGLLIGIMVTSAIPIKASVQEFLLSKVTYDIMIDGVEYLDEEKPILNYQGTTYAPLRSLLEANNLQVNWNAELKIAEISKDKTIIQSLNTVPLVILDNIDSLIYRENEIEMINYNGKIYMQLIYGNRYGIYSHQSSKIGYCSIWMRTNNNTIRNYKISDGTFMCFRDSKDRMNSAAYITKDAFLEYLSEFNIKY